MKAIILLLLAISFYPVNAQNRYELHSGWKCISIQNLKEKGENISQPSFPLEGFLDATVPGTVLTTLLNNRLVPDPFFGMNNEKIADIYDTGSDYYTYWFVNDFEETTKKGEHIWLNFRGINYSCDVFLNGTKLNQERFSGMFLRQKYDITTHLNKKGKNRLAVIVYPPDPVGNPNGGQGGDGTIARNVAHQYVAGWDWIQPVRDRNTGIWDKVTIEKTGAVNVQNVHVITEVPRVRMVEGAQQPAILKVTAELENASAVSVEGVLKYELNGEEVSRQVTIPPQSKILAALPHFTIHQPLLWWPNGYGPQNLYSIAVTFVAEGKTSDAEGVKFGVREIVTGWNERTRSAEVRVNGQKIFMKGGNWIISDAMLRFSPERYDAEVRFHRDMNLNLIRVWGGAITERPEFYQACDKYGLLVMQDFWFSGDCNGRWIDPSKKDDQWTRRQYPDDHSLFLTSAADQVKMIRNHPSLAFWCGGNEITPPDDLLTALRDSILPLLDGTRFFFEYSNSDSMSYNTVGGTGDGPYGIQDIATFWTHQTYPFNSEVGSVGIGDNASLKRFLPAEGFPASQVDSVWKYHKYIGYGNHINAYGKPLNRKDFANKAQLVNYNQYRGLVEGFSAHMWEWYSGVIIWKTQNPWTAMRGQMYDYYLDPNAGLYGLRNGSEPLHVMYNPVDGMLMVVNNAFTPQHNFMLQATAYSLDGKGSVLTQVFSEIGPTRSKKYASVKKGLDRLAAKEGAFLSLRLLDADKQILSDNIYWLPDSIGNYSGLGKMGKADVQVAVKKISAGKLEVSVRNPAGGPVAFFNRFSLMDSKTKERILPVFYSDNYVSVLPGEEKKVVIEFDYELNKDAAVEVFGWNVVRQEKRSE